jgi:hypothetical protein
MVYAITIKMRSGIARLRVQVQKNSGTSSSSSTAVRMSIQSFFILC